MRGVPLHVELAAQPAGDVAQGEPGTAYPVAGLAVCDLPQAIGLQVGGRQERPHRLLGPGRLLSRRVELTPRLVLRGRHDLLGPGPGVGQDLVGRLPHLVAVDGGGLPCGPGFLLGLLEERAGLRLRRRQQRLAAGLCGVDAGGHQVARLGVVLVGACLGSSDPRIGLLLRFGAQPVGALVGLALVLLRPAESLGGDALGLRDDLVVVGLSGLHQEPGLVTGVRDDLLGVGRARVEGLLSQVARVRGLGMELLGLRLQALGLHGQRARLLLGLGLELLGHPLGMPKQGCSLLVPGWPGGGGGFRLALYRDHPTILPEDRREREGSG